MRYNIEYELNMDGGNNMKYSIADLIAELGARLAKDLPQALNQETREKTRFRFEKSISQGKFSNH